jgi:hypothetical protein
MKMKMFAFSLVAALMVSVSVHAQTGPSLTVVPFNGQNNPCANPSVVKTVKGVALSAGTTELVAAVAGTKVHMCSFLATFGGTTPAVTFITGTRTTNPCDTGAANLSGALLPTSGTYVAINPETSSFAISATSGEVCALVVGSVQGVMTYVQM